MRRGPSPSAVRKRGQRRTAGDTAAVPFAASRKTRWLSLAFSACRKPRKDNKSQGGAGESQAWGWLLSASRHPAPACRSREKPSFRKPSAFLGFHRLFSAFQRGKSREKPMRGQAASGPGALVRRPRIRCLCTLSKQRRAPGGKAQRRWPNSSHWRLCRTLQEHCQGCLRNAFSRISPRMRRVRAFRPRVTAVTPRATKCEGP